MAADTQSPPRANGDAPKDAAGQVKQQAEQATEKAKTGLRDQLDERSTQVGEKIATQASDVRSLSDELRNQGKDGPARLAEQAADRAEQVGSWLTESDADRLMGDIEDYARQNPWTVAAGGLALGFLASRFLKASSDERSTRLSQPGQTPRTSARPQLPSPPATSVPPVTTPQPTGTGTPTPTGQTPPSTGAL